MARHLRQFLFGVAACWFLLCGGANAQEAESAEASSAEAKAESETIQEGPIDSGYVILDGRYLPPPYVLQKRDSDLWINDQLAISGWFKRRNSGGPAWGNGGPGSRGPGGFPGSRPRPESASPGPEGPDGPPANGRGPDGPPPDEERSREPGQSEDGPPGPRPDETSPDRPRRGDEGAANRPPRGAGGFGGFRPGGRGGPGVWGRGMGAGRGNWAAAPNNFWGKFALGQLAASLRDNGTIIAGEGLRGATLPADDTAVIVVVLLSDRDEAEKLNLVLAETGNQMDEASWQHFAATFVPSDALLERMGPEIEKARRIIEENDASHRAAVAALFWSSKPVKYVVTLIAMGLVVAACGTLLNYRPKARTRWAEIDDSGDGIPIVVRSVVLLILLGIFDLAATLIAQKAGGFVELNPLGDQLIGNPLLLTVFKMTSLLMACAILYVLRRYRGAQTAAWWMCLLCTVLTFRWLTYGSMFM